MFNLLWDLKGEGSCQSYLISDDVLLSQKFEIGENTHHEIHLEKDKVPVFLNQFFLKKH